MLEKIGNRFEKIARQYMPDPFALVLLLTLAAFALALWMTPTQPSDLLQSWNGGFWELLAFAMQMALIVVTGEAIAEAALVRKLIQKACAIPKSAASAVAMLTFFSMALGWLHWGLGLIMASLAARELGRSLGKRKIAVHYPVLGAAAYMSMLLWHAGTTASAPLLINTAGHFLEKQIGIIPLSQTVFSRPNLIVCGFLAATIPFVVAGLLPRRNLRTMEDFKVEGIEPLRASEEKGKTIAEKLERSYSVNFTIGFLGLIFLGKYFYREGLNLNHNIVNFLFISIGLLLHRHPLAYAKAVAGSVRGTSGILLQFPFYGGIMGLMRESGLGHQIADQFARFATAQTLPAFAYLASVATKFFIPSGGGEWAVEGPVMLSAAKTLGASLGSTAMGIAYGNMVGNLFQPFWAIPLLSIMGLHARDIMGFCLAVFVFAFPILGIALLMS